MRLYRLGSSLSELKNFLSRAAPVRSISITIFYERYPHFCGNRRRAIKTACEKNLPKTIDKPYCVMYSIV